jgi:hypothetical protein
MKEIHRHSPKGVTGFIQNGLNKPPLTDSSPGSDQAQQGYIISIDYIMNDTNVADPRRSARKLDSLTPDRYELFRLTRPLVEKHSVYFIRFEIFFLADAVAARARSALRWHRP